MKKVILVMLALVVACLVRSTVVAGSWRGLDCPLPKDLNVIKPSADVPPKIAALSGYWEGEFISSVSSAYNRNVQVVVESIDSSNNTTVVYSWGIYHDKRGRHDQIGGYYRGQGTIDEEGRLVIKFPDSGNRVEMILVGAELHLTYVNPGGQSNAVLYHVQR